MLLSTSLVSVSAVLALGRRASLSRFLSEQREMRATVRMAIIIACFCGMWLGFFVLYVVSGWCPSAINPFPSTTTAPVIVARLASRVRLFRYQFFGHRARLLFQSLTTSPMSSSPSPWFRGVRQPAVPCRGL